MKLFDCFKYVVRLPSCDAGFFTPLCPPCPTGNFLIKISSDPPGCRPTFSDVPTLYPRRSAKFLVRELRRVGYNARLFPFWILIARDFIRSFVRRLKNHSTLKNKWR